MIKTTKCKWCKEALESNMTDYCLACSSQSVLENSMGYKGTWKQYEALLDQVEASKITFHAFN